MTKKYTEENYLSIVIEYLEELKDMYREIDKDEEALVSLIDYLQETN